MTDSYGPRGSGPDPYASAPMSAGEQDRIAAARDDAARPTGWERQTLERLAFEALAEQRSTRRWRIFTRLLWLLLIVALAWWLFFRSVPGGAVKPSVHTAVVEIRGEIGAEGNASAEHINAAMKSALEDSGSKALVLLINSPGGSPVQAGMINDEIRRLRARHAKPIYAVVEESCASAAYYIAAATDKIYVNKASIVGSIGVLIDGFGFVGLMDKLGIERRLLTAGTNKGFLDPFSPQSDAQRAHAQQMIDLVHQQFIDIVKVGRGDRLKETPEMFSGLFWIGQRAIDLGLADQLGSVDFVARDVVKAEELVDYTQHEGMFERVIKRFGMAVGEGSARVLREAPALR